MQLIDIIEHFLETENITLALEYQIYLTALVISSIKYGYDPRNALGAIVKTLRHDSCQSVAGPQFESLLISTAHIVRSIAPFYLRDALELVKVIETINSNQLQFPFC